MKPVVAIFSLPQGKRRVPDPVLDPPTAVAILDEQGGFSFEELSNGELSDSLEDRVKQVMVGGAGDATPRTPLGERYLAGALARGQDVARAKALWEGRVARSKRGLLHFEKTFGEPAPWTGGTGLSGEVVWQTLEAGKYPGEKTLALDSEAALQHLRCYQKVLEASGWRSEGEPWIGAEVELPDPGLGVGLFYWLKSGGGDEKSKMDPRKREVRGYVFATTRGVVIEEGSEAEMIEKGVSVLDKVRYSCALIVEDKTSFGTFTLGRAARWGIRLPSWILFPSGAEWMRDFSRFCPALESEKMKWILRLGVATGVTQCSKILESGEEIFSTKEQASVATRAILQALAASPYFDFKEEAPVIGAHGKFSGVAAFS